MCELIKERALRLMLNDKTIIYLVTTPDFPKTLKKLHPSFMNAMFDAKDIPCNMGDIVQQYINKTTNCKMEAGVL